MARMRFLTSLLFARLLRQSEAAPFASFVCPFRSNSTWEGGRQLCTQGPTEWTLHRASLHDSLCPDARPHIVPARTRDWIRHPVSPN
eukprot:184766-Prorocentrum_minimum.AAC.1